MEPSIAPQADLDLPARVIYGEARGEPEIGQVALAWVIKTRAEWPGGAWWGKTPAEVCADPFQFSCMNDSDPNKRKLLTLPITDPHYTLLSHLFADVIAVSIPDPTDGETHYKGYACPVTITASPNNYPAASSSVWRWRARWSIARKCCSSTSRWARSI